MANTITPFPTRPPKSSEPAARRKWPTTEKIESAFMSLEPALSDAFRATEIAFDYVMKVLPIRSKAARNKHGQAIFMAEVALDKVAAVRAQWYRVHKEIRDGDEPDED
jgi:hypothetical protein